MIYILDNNIISMTLKNVPIKIFKDEIYLPLKQMIEDGRVISVDEVYEELSVLFSPKEEFWKLIKPFKSYFEYLTNDECKILMEIYTNAKFREGVKEVSLRKGSPEADAMIVAKAKNLGAIVVTEESNEKENADKLPNMCVAYGVKYIKRVDFYQVLKNVRLGKDELEDVTIWTTLNIKKEE